MSESSITPGHIVWHEMNSQDPPRSAAFYSELFGWSVDSSNPNYTLFRSGSAAVSGMLKLPPPHVPSHWLPYVSVSDVDASCARASAAAFKALTDAMDVSNGRVQVVKDPQGAILCLWRSGTGDPAPSSEITVGRFCWDQLNSPDAAGAFEAYSAVFGWERQAGFASASAAELSTLLLGSRPIAGLMQGPSSMAAHWLGFVAVDSLDRTCSLTQQLGGKVFVEHVRVTGRGACCVLQDSLGAVFAAFEPSPS